MSAFPIALGRLGFGRPARGKAKKKAKKRSRAKAVSAEYNMLLTATLCLLALGAVMVFSASSTTRILQDGGLSDSAFYLKRTLMFGAVGLLIMHLTARHGLQAVRNLTPAILGFCFFMLVAVLAIGTSVNGASRWIGSGFLQIQPSEIAKVALVLYGADLLARKPKRARSIEGFMPFLVVVGLACALIMLEPDMGTTMVVTFAVAATLIAAGARPRDLGLIALAIGAAALLMTIVEPYRMARLTGFLNPGSDAAGAGFQAAQAKIALGSGGLFGVGIGNGVQKAFYLPEAHTDMILATVGEELGVIGVVGVLVAFGLFALAGYRIAIGARDLHQQVLAAGLTTLVVMQAFINIGAVVGVLPVTGVPLPFVSFGGSSLIILLAASGLLVNIGRRSSSRAIPSAVPARQGDDRGRRDGRPRDAGSGGRRRAAGAGG
ncbi:MAG TPA: putative lipid II flippase FtsW [Solirubrobacterales bacterium]